MPCTIHVQVCGIRAVKTFHVKANPKNEVEVEDAIDIIVLYSGITLETHEVFFHFNDEAECRVVHIKHLREHLQTEGNVVNICLHALVKSPNTQLADEGGIVLRLDSTSAPIEPRERVAAWIDQTILLPTPPGFQYDENLGPNHLVAQDWKDLRPARKTTKNEDKQKSCVAAPASKRKKAFSSDAKTDKSNGSDESAASHIIVATRKML